MFKLTLILSQVIIMSETEDINSCSKPKISHTYVQKCMQWRKWRNWRKIASCWRFELEAKSGHSPIHSSETVFSKQAGDRQSSTGYLIVCRWLL